MMTRGRPVSGPASRLLRRFGVGRSMGDRRLDGALALRQRPGPDLVEARAAIDGAIVPRRERHDGLTPAGPADRGMELARALVRSARLATARHDGQRWGSLVNPLLAKKACSPAGEAELLGAVATGQATVLVHPLQTLLGSDAMTVEVRDDRVGNGSAAGAVEGGAPGRPGLGARNS